MPTDPNRSEPGAVLTARELLDTLRADLAAAVSRAEKAEAERDAARAALAEAQWQDISTAPRDGDPVLLWAEAWEGSWGVQIGFFRTGQWHTAEGSADENEPGFDPDADVDEDFDPDAEANIGPTHWMPLPPAPRQDRATAEREGQRD